VTPGLETADRAPDQEREVLVLAQDKRWRRDRAATRILRAVGAVFVGFAAFAGLATGQVITTFTIPTADSQPQGIVGGPDGNLWITDVYNEQILKLTPGGSYTGFPLHNYSAPLGICSGPDRALWFADDGLPPEIGRITTSGQIKLFPIPALANDIAAGPDGALWFTQPNSGQIGRITKRGKVTEFSKGISFDAKPYSIAPGPDGALWFTERSIGQIGRITTAGKVTEYSSGITPTEQPFDIAAGPDGAMWFTEYETYGSYQVRASKIGRITMQGKITEHSIGINPKAGPTGITRGYGDRLWFVESSRDMTGRINI